MSFNTPVLFLIFNRPDTTARVFEAIRQMRPAKLFVAADGPRAERGNDEVEKCSRTRDIVMRNIDWPCEVKTLFRDSNLGCGKSVSSAITWFFENVEQGIILEDDCLPHNDFFKFCEELLVKYKDDRQVMSIAGSNFLKGNRQGNASYYFSSHFHVWGWASWRRAWGKYNFNTENMVIERLETIIRQRFISDGERKFIREMFADMKSGYIDTWDYQWFFAHLFNDGVVAVPNVNLISNIGYEGTHFKKGSNNPRINLKTMSILPIVFDENKILARDADKLLYKICFMPRRNIFNIMKSKIKFILRPLLKIKTIICDMHISFIRNLDGKTGDRLRYRYYKKRLKYLGCNSKIDTGVFLYGPEYISIGDNTHIDKGSILVASSSDIDLSYRTLQEHKNDKINIKKGEIYIGKNTHIAQNCMIFGYGGVKIGDNSTMSTGAKIYSLTSLPNNPFDKKQIVSIMPYSGISPSSIGPVELGENVWLGINVLVFPGVQIENNSFVRTNSIVQDSFGENSYIAGDPAKYIKKRFE